VWCVSHPTFFFFSQPPLPLFFVHAARKKEGTRYRRGRQAGRFFFFLATFPKILLQALTWGWRGLPQHLLFRSTGARWSNTLVDKIKKGLSKGSFPFLFPSIIVSVFFFFQICACVRQALHGYTGAVELGRRYFFFFFFSFFLFLFFSFVCMIGFVPPPITLPRGPLKKL